MGVNKLNQDFTRVVNSDSSVVGVYEDADFDPITELTSINAVVQAFVDANSISNQTEINALNTLYVNLTTLVDAHSGSVLYLNGVSPTSYAAAREAIIFGTGNETATEIGTGITHSNDGVLFDGSSNGWNLGNILNSIDQNRVMVVMSRTNSITATGTSCGVQYTATEDIIMAPRLSADNSTYNLPINYTAGPSFEVSGNWIGYHNGTTYGLWKDGVFQTPASNNNPAANPTSSNDFYLGCRNLNGSPFGYVDERIASFCVIDDGGNMFSQSQIEDINSYFETYNNTVV